MSDVSLVKSMELKETIYYAMPYHSGVTFCFFTISVLLGSCGQSTEVLYDKAPL